MEKPDINTFYFLQGGGENAEIIRQFDWASTSIGAPDSWAKSLKNTVAMLLSSQFPMFLWWGDDLIQFYNDAYRPSLGNDGKHPQAMGRTGKETWPEIWDFIYPLITQVLTTGEGVKYENLLLPIYRNGKLEDVYWTFSYSPVRDDEGRINGVLVVCTETTKEVVHLEELKTSKEEFEFAIEATELGTWDLNPATGKFIANARLKEWFGILPSEEIPLELATSVIAERDRQRTIDSISKALDYHSGGSYDIEYSILNPRTNKERIVRARGKALFNAEKQASRFNGTLQDITSERKAQEETAVANQLTDLAIKSIGIGIFRVDFSTGMVDSSPVFTEILTGNKNKKYFTREEFIRHLHPEDQHIREAAIETGLLTGEFQYIARVIWDDGSIHRIVIVGAQVKDLQGKSAGFSGTARDITQAENQRIALEEAELLYSRTKRESEALFRNVTDSSPTGLWLSDTNGNLTYLNKTLAEWTGMAYEDLLGTGWSDAIIEDDRPHAITVFLDAVNARVHYDVEFRLQKCDGSVVWCRAAGDPFYDANGDYAGYAGFCMDIQEIILGRKALIESELLFRSIVDQAPVATCLFTGKEMLIEVANDIMLGYWGKDRLAIGKPLEVAVPELKDQPFLGILDEVFTSGIEYTDKGAAVSLEVDGVIEIYYFDFTYKPLRQADGTIYGVMNMSVDVTQNVLAQQRIEEVQRQLLASFEESPVGIAILDRHELTFTMANPFYGELVGRKPGEIIGKPLLEALPELRGQGFEELIRQVIATGIPFSANEAAVDLERNGVMETIYVNLTYQPRRESNQRISSVLVVATDVTAQVLARHEIEDTQIALRGAIELAQLATWKLDLKSGLFTYSGRFKKWLGFGHTITSMEEFYSAMPPNDGQRAREAIYNAVQAGSKGSFDSEYQIVNQATGQLRIVHANARVFYDAQGNPDYLSGTAQNVTQDRRLKQELEFKVKERTNELEAANYSLEMNNQELQQFAYIASHDLQEPVRKIAIFMQMLENSLENVPPKARNYIDKIAAATERMTSLIRDVLGLSQLSNDVHVFEKVDLSQTAEEIITEFELAIEQKNATLTYSGLPEIMAIPVQMSQLFGNLISNSLKYSREDIPPEIAITAQMLTDDERAAYTSNSEIAHVKIQFSDNGIGFDSQYAEKIFNIFQRLHSKTQYVGTGIGLAMCRKIAQNHHGFIQASSTAGQGAVFTVVLPVLQG